MALIVETIVQGANPTLLTATTMTANDTLNYRAGAGQVLILHNGTAGSLTVSIADSDVTSVQVEGVGTVAVAPTTQVLAAGARAAIALDNSRRKWQGVIQLTGGTGISAVLTAAQ